VTNLQVDKDELRALLERVLFTTQDEQVFDRARQFLLSYYTPNVTWHPPSDNNLGGLSQDD